MNIIPSTLGGQAGIQRDGTVYISSSYTSGQNVRFYHGWPTKLLGSEGIATGNSEIVTSIAFYPRTQSNDIYMGRRSSLRFFNLQPNGQTSNETSRTPSDIVVDDKNLWNFTSYSTSAGSSQNIYIVANVVPNLADPTSQVQGTIYSGLLSDSTPLTPLLGDNTSVSCSGPVIFYDSYVIGLDNGGLLNFLKVGGSSGWQTQIIASTKLVAAVVYQGSLLVWSLDTLYRLQILDTPSGEDIFSVQALGPTSIWSANSVVVYKNIVYWVGNGQFFRFSGAIDSIRNTMSNTWFFDAETGVNRNYIGSIYSFIDFQNDEWWILYPRGDSIVNNYAQIYSPGLDKWWDTPIDRGTGLSISTYPYRIMTATSLYQKVLSNGQIIETYPIFEHEKGVDEIYDNQVKPVVAFLESPIMDFFTANPGADNNVCMRTLRFEPDFILEGELTLNIITRMYAQSVPVVSKDYTITPTTEKIDIDAPQGRLVSVRITCNTLGSYFEVGRNLHGIMKGSGAA